jgi:hypothetical protein
VAHITHVIIHADVSEAPAAVEALKNFDSNGFRLRSLTEDDAAAFWGGQKYPECELWAGAFKALDLDAFWQYVNAIDWKYPESAQVFLSDEPDTRFQVWLRGASGFLQVVDGGEQL